MGCDAFLKSWNESMHRDRHTNLENHKRIAAVDYGKSVKLFESFKSLKTYYRAGGYFGVIGTTWAYLTDFFRGYDYSMTQALLRSTAIIAPAIVLIQADRPVFAFFHKSLILYGLLRINVS